MGWIDSGDTKTILVQGVMPLVIGIGLCCLGFLYMLGILKLSCRRHHEQVAPVNLGSGSGSGDSNEEVMTPQAAEKAYGAVACAAQLYGMQQKERQAVLEQIFSTCCTHIESREALKDDDQKNAEAGDVITVEIDTRNACAICLRDYEDSDVVMNGNSCDHLFHKSCVLLWLTNYKRPKDHCPYCRKEMMSAAEMRKAALQVLGEERVKELSQFPIPNNNTNTNTNTNTGNQVEGGVPTLEQVPDIESGLRER